MIKDTNKNLNDLLVERMRFTYSNKPWYGRSFNDLIGEVDFDNIEIQSLVLHILSWRQYAIDLFSGGRPKIVMNSEEDWPKASSSKEEIIDQLQITEQQLFSIFETFDPQKWGDRVWHNEYSYYYLASGVIDHDIYHIGQIVLYHKINI